MTLPLVTLQPLVSPRHHWVGLMLRATAREAADVQAAIERLFDAEDLGGALGKAVCVIDADAAAIDALRPELSRRNLLASCDLPATQLARAETPEAFEAAREAGVHWIAGNYALHPKKAATNALGPNPSTLITLLGQVTSDADTRDIEMTLRRDPQLSFQLLKLVNSAAFSTQKQITSFAQAIAILGRRQLQRWLQLLMYAQQHRHDGDASPLLPRAAQRAALMEGLAAGGSVADQEQAFMVGMFSLLHILFTQSLEQVIAPLHLPAPIAAALLRREGRLGACLAAVEAAENDADAALEEAVAAIGASHDDWCHVQALAARWALQVSAH